jgi:HSP20 family protein
MANLVRWDPLRDMVSLRQAIDRLFEESFVRPRGWSAPSEGIASLALDVIESDEDVTIKASIPGVKPEDIDISITGDMLTIKGETCEEREEEKGHYHLRERCFGAFQRAIRLPTMVKADKANAEFEQGVLTLTLPKVEEVKPKSIKIKAK